MSVSDTVAASQHRERSALHRKYRPLIAHNPELNRQLVSVQANRGVPLYGWFKYKEGFSAEIVAYLLSALAPVVGHLLDPFAGTGTALLAANRLGWQATGIEVLPLGQTIFEARTTAEKVSLPELRRAIDLAASKSWQANRNHQLRFRHIPITRFAFSEETECAIEAYAAFCDQQDDRLVKRLLEFAGLCVLESVSFTRKDGQYLRWDARSGKTKGSSFNKGQILEFGDAITDKLETIYRDIRELRQPGINGTPQTASVNYQVGSCLELLPDMKSGSVDMVLTSPPYCNRYDYTRTYALELVHLGADDAAIKSLRQTMLSCTVENREKQAQLQQFYSARGKADEFVTIDGVFHAQQALGEVLKILEAVRDAGKLNNPNIPKMVGNYFYEMAFVIFELARILAPGGKVVMINDNVRYAGEEVPVDLILSEFAARFGLTTTNIWTLSRGKGNSSQQMGVHGRSELRKCVYVWEKPGR